MLKVSCFMNIRILAAVAALLGLPTIPARAQLAADPSSIWTLQDENASISAGKLTDRYYVNGLRLGWTSPTGQVPTFLANLGRSLWEGGQQRIAIDLSQQIYTPAVTNTTVPDSRDRPYAGLLIANFSLISDTEDTRNVLKLGLGVVGPASGAEQLQNGFHDVISQSHTNGWGQPDSEHAGDRASARTNLAPAHGYHRGLRN